MVDILGGIGTIASGILNYMGAKDAREQQAQQFAQNIQLQKDFAQQGIRWKVEDAKAAGIHPLYALGASTTSFSPVSVGAVNTMSPLADMAKGLGQDLSRSVDATRTASERANARVQGASNVLQLENMKLRNDLLRSQIARLNATPNPPFPEPGSGNYITPGSGNDGYIKPDAMKVAPGAANQPSSEGGAIADVGYARTTTGWAPIPSKDVKERIEDSFIPETLWAVRNNMLPTMGMNLAPPPFKPPEGKAWVYNPLKQEYQLYDRGHWWERVNRTPYWTAHH